MPTYDNLKHSVELKAGQLDPNDAFQKMTTDWVAYYRDKFQGDSGGFQPNDSQ
jgi:hypothetical protein